MSVFFEKGRGWKFDFTLQGKRYTGKYCKTKKAAKEEEARKREEILNPPEDQEIQIDMAFKELINLRLDHLIAYNSPKHYQDTRYSAKKWVRRWDGLNCGDMNSMMIREYLLERRDVSPVVANKELRYLRSTFNFGIKEGYIKDNPTNQISFFPIEKRVKHIPAPNDINLVIELADCNTQDYLYAIWETLGRMSEINRLRWEDVNLSERFVVLYTRKKRGGHLTPRKIKMTGRLFEILSRRNRSRDRSVPWVFSHRYWSAKDGEWKTGPYTDRKKFMKGLCREAGVKYFRFHALRHSGASTMDNNNVPIGAIQEILGHEHRTTTEIYLHGLSGSAQRAMEIYEMVRVNSHSNPHSN
jgi:integrase